MKKAVFSLIAGILLCGATFFVLTNSHSDFFPCTELEKSPGQMQYGLRPRRITTTCSLMEVQRDLFDQDAKLTDAGMGLALVVHLVAFALGAGLGAVALSKRQRGATPV